MFIWAQVAAAIRSSSLQHFYHFSDYESIGPMQVRVIVLRHSPLRKRTSIGAGSEPNTVLIWFIQREHIMGIPSRGNG